MNIDGIHRSGPVKAGLNCPPAPGRRELLKMRYSPKISHVMCTNHHDKAARFAKNSTPCPAWSLGSRKSCRASSFAGPKAAEASASLSGREGSLPEPVDALIVGAGPAGLATALLLAQRQEAGCWRQIVVLEKRPSIDEEDADKSYVYGIDGRGFSLTDTVGVTGAVEAVGVVVSFRSIASVLPDGTFSERRAEHSERRSEVKDATRSNVWLPRRAFIQALYGGLVEAESRGTVRIVNNVQVTSIDVAAQCVGGSSGSGSGNGGIDGDTAVLPSPIVVSARDAATGRELSFAPRLLVGADGFQSEVRRALEVWSPRAGLAADHYRPVLLNSPSAGLRFKVLPLPPNPPFRRKKERQPQQGQQQGDKQLQQGQREQPSGGRGSSTINEGIENPAVMLNPRLIVIAGVQAPRGRAMRLGLLPVRDPAAPRTANVIAPPDHEFWSLTDGKQLGAFLQASFPQLDIPALFTEQQLQQVAAARGGTFPPPQYLRHFTAVLPPAAAATRAATVGGAVNVAAAGCKSGCSSCCGVALVGDAIHCFPPDLGQGVNSAMVDVMELAKALDETGNDLGRALPLYETRRAPEAAALAEIMTFGAPYQYNQDSFRRMLWFLNILLRGALHQLAPWAFWPQTFTLLQRTEMSYSQIRDRVHATTARIWALAGVLVAVGAGLAAKAAIAAVAAAATGTPQVVA